MSASVRKAASRDLRAQPYVGGALDQLHVLRLSGVDLRLGISPEAVYIPPMRKRKSQRERRVATWEISRLRGTPAAFIGLIDAPDEVSAKELAIKQFDVRPEDQKRLIAVRHR
jgi:hypothetical protein